MYYSSQSAFTVDAAVTIPRPEIILHQQQSSSNNDAQLLCNGCLATMMNLKAATPPISAATTLPVFSASIPGTRQAKVPQNYLFLQNMKFFFKLIFHFRLSQTVGCENFLIKNIFFQIFLIFQFLINLINKFESIGRLQPGDSLFFSVHRFRRTSANLLWLRGEAVGREDAAGGLPIRRILRSTTEPADRICSVDWQEIDMEKWFIFFFSNKLNYTRYKTMTAGVIHKKSICTYVS